MDYQRVVRGRDERVPPKSGPDKQVPPNLEGHACRARVMPVETGAIVQCREADVIDTSLRGGLARR
jgi:hypothetical protein